VLGDRVDWSVTDYLLARVAHLLAGANWQRSGGKGPKPKPVKLPDAKSARDRKAAGEDTARRLRNLGLIPGPVQQRPLTPAERALAEALARAQQRNRPDLS
jgi:hypothetical protein